MSLTVLRVVDDRTVVMLDQGARGLPGVNSSENVHGYGATGLGAANDSAAFTSALTAKKNATLRPGASYSIKDVGLSNSQSIIGLGQVISAFAGAANVFTLADYNPRVGGLYVSTAINAGQAAFRVKASRYASLTDITAVNCGPGFINLTVDTPASEVCALTKIANCDAEDVTGIGINVGSSVSEIRGSNIHLYGKLTPGTGGDRPMFTTTGLRANTPVINGIAAGGHQIVNANMITFNRGFHFSDAQLWKISNSFADTCSDYGVLLDGYCDFMEFADLYCGATRGIKVAGTSVNISFKGLRTQLTGQIPPGSATDFYNGVTTFYDFEVRDSAQAYITGWTGSKKIAVDTTARLVIDQGIFKTGRSIGVITASGADVVTFLAEFGAGGEDDCKWRAPYDCYIMQLFPTPDADPGVGKSFTYTARKQFADTALVATLTGAGAFGGANVWHQGTPIALNRGETYSIKLRVQDGAFATRHNCEIQIVAR